LNSEVKRLREAVVSTEADGMLVGDSPAMVRVRDLIQRVGPSDASVLIHGETGTGKELVARAVHAASMQKDGPFVAINCAALTATHRDIEADVEKRRFREDLYYRVNVVKIDVPPLRDREGDILTLAMRFLTRFAARSGKGTLAISPQAARRLLAYNWPGNVRE